MSFNRVLAVTVALLTVGIIATHHQLPQSVYDAFYYAEPITEQRGPDNDRDADTIPNALDEKPDCPSIYNPKRPDYTNFGGEERCTEYQSTSPEVMAAIERGPDK